MKDQIEQWESAAEHNYDVVIQPDGKHKCQCGKVFNPDKEGGFLSPNPYTFPVCGDCFDEYINNHSKE